MELIGKRKINLYGFIFIIWCSGNVFDREYRREAGLVANTSRVSLFVVGLLDHELSF